MIDAAALKSEITTDSTGIGLATPFASGTLGVVVDALNLVRTTIDVDRPLVPAYEVWEAIVPTEWAALSAQEKQRIQTILSMGTVYTKGANTRASFQAAFAGGTTTRTNLTNLLTRKGSRAEQLFGQAVTLDDVVRARSA